MSYAVVSISLWTVSRREFMKKLWVILRSDF